MAQDTFKLSIQEARMIYVLLDELDELGELTDLYTRLGREHVLYAEGVSPIDWGPTRKDRARKS